jgi:phthiocerol/phenolphthiocerol synthesis type-I polyketide synthase E
LYELIKNIDLDILVMFSSIAAVLPRHGECDYRAANSFLDAFSYFASSQGRFRTLTINWSGWREIGMLTGLKPLAGLEKQRAAALKNAILTSDGLEAFKRALTSRLPQVIVSPRELETVVAEDRRMLLESFDSVARAPIVTANGERAIDGARTESENAMDAPRTTLERTLTGIWIDLFGLADISIHDDFFALGGHSLLAVRLFSKIHQLTGQKLPLATLLEASTIDELAGLISEGRK